MVCVPIHSRVYADKPVRCRTKGFPGETVNPRTTDQFASRGAPRIIPSLQRGKKKATGAEGPDPEPTQQSNDVAPRYGAASRELPLQQCRRLPRESQCGRCWLCDNLLRAALRLENTGLGFTMLWADPQMLVRFPPRRPVANFFEPCGIYHLGVR